MGAASPPLASAFIIFSRPIIPMPPTARIMSRVISNCLMKLPTSFAGLTPGFVGLYQANVILPDTFPPGLSLPLTLKQGDAVSNTVVVSIQ